MVVVPEQRHTTHHSLPAPAILDPKSPHFPSYAQGSDHPVSTGCSNSTSEEVSSLLQQNARLETALADQRDLNQLKAQFIATVAHELRSPMTIIRTTTELLNQRGDTISPNVKQAYLGGINASLERMGRLIDDLLLIGEADSGKLQFSPAPVNLHQLCQDLIAELTPSTASNADRICQDRISLCYQGSPVAKVDARLFHYILSNLLSNALKYSSTHASVQLDINCETEHRMLTCRIQDHGIGIPESDQSHLFESFYRASNVGKVAGTGMGLAIVKRFVTLHHGHIDVESQVGVGTTFTVTLPLS